MTSLATNLGEIRAFDHKQSEGQDSEFFDHPCVRYGDETEFFRAEDGDTLGSFGAETRQFDDGCGVCNTPIRVRKDIYSSSVWLVYWHVSNASYLYRNVLETYPRRGFKGATKCSGRLFISAVLIHSHGHFSWLCLNQLLGRSAKYVTFLFDIYCKV